MATSKPLTARQVMKILYPGLEGWKSQANARWLDQTAILVKKDGLLIFFALLFLFSGCVFNDPRTGEDCPCHNLTECRPCHHDRAQSWDQETLHSQARLKVCADRNYVFGTDADGNLGMCI